jgi:hypothetical protein
MPLKTDFEDPFSSKLLEMLYTVMSHLNDCYKWHILCPKI